MTSPKHHHSNGISAVSGLISFNQNLHYLLSEDAYGLLMRTQGALSGLAGLLFEACKSQPNPEHIGDLCQMAADTLQAVIDEIDRTTVQNRETAA